MSNLIKLNKLDNHHKSTVEIIVEVSRMILTIKNYLSFKNDVYIDDLISIWKSGIIDDWWFNKVPLFSEVRQIMDDIINGNLKKLDILKSKLESIKPILINILLTKEDN